MRHFKRFELLEDEQIILEKPIHWKNYIVIGGLFLALCIFFIFRTANTSWSLLNALAGQKIVGPEVARLLSFLEAMAFAVLMGIVFIRIAAIMCIRYYVTNRRIIKTTGFFTIVNEEMMLMRCETVYLKSSIYERIFDCGDIFCLAPGSNIYLDDVPQPEEFKRTILNELAKKNAARN